MGGRFKNQLVQPFNLAFIFFGVVTVTGFTALSIRCMLKKPERLFVALWHDCVEHGWPHIRKGMPLFLVFPVVLSTFTSAKNAISGYQWDASFIALDAALHGGDAWLLRQPVVA